MSDLITKITDIDEYRDTIKSDDEIALDHNLEGTPMATTNGDLIDHLIEIEDAMIFASNRTDHPYPVSAQVPVRSLTELEPLFETLGTNSITDIITDPNTYEDRTILLGYDFD